MVDSKCSAGDYKSSKVKAIAVMKNTEILKFVPDHVEIMCNDAV